MPLSIMEEEEGPVFFCCCRSAVAAIGFTCIFTASAAGVESWPNSCFKLPRRRDTIPPPAPGGGPPAAAAPGKVGCLSPPAPPPEVEVE